MIVYVVQPGGGTPSSKEIEFMKILNSDQTFKLSANISMLSSIAGPTADSEARRMEENRMSILGSGTKTPAQVYNEYAPKVVQW